jgi:hypothetical protein
MALCKYYIFIYILVFFHNNFINLHFIDLGVVLKAFNISLIFLELHLFLFFLCEFSSMPDGSSKDHQNQKTQN